MQPIQILAKQFQMQSRLFRNVLEGITEEESHVRLNDHVNHLRWIAGHLTAIRFRSSQQLGLNPEPFIHIEKYAIPGAPPPGNRPISSDIDYPPLKELLRYWNSYADPFVAALKQMPAEVANTEGTFQSPVEGKTTLDTFAFIASHEALHIGQMAFIRKSLGHEGMAFL